MASNNSSGISIIADVDVMSSPPPPPNNQPPGNIRDHIMRASREMEEMAEKESDPLRECTSCTVISSLTFVMVGSYFGQLATIHSRPALRVPLVALSAGSLYMAAWRWWM